MPAKAKHEQHNMLRKLQKLQASIQQQHKELCSQARGATINRVRDERLSAIQAGDGMLLSQLLNSLHTLCNLLVVLAGLLFAFSQQ